MRKLVLTTIALATLCSPVFGQAVKGKWHRMQVVPTPQHAEMWEKKIGQRVCVVSVSVKGEVRAVLLRGVTKELTGTWHIMEWLAPTIAAAKDRRMQLQGMWGNMITGMEVASRDYFIDECDDLPPL